MDKRIRSTLIVAPLFILLIASVGFIYAAVKPRDVDVIRVAYMNGYLQALQLDPDNVKKLKSDEALLKQTVENAADSYLGVITTMNK